MKRFVVYVLLLLLPGCFGGGDADHADSDAAADSATDNANASDGAAGNDLASADGSPITQTPVDPPPVTPADKEAGRLRKLGSQDSKVLAAALDDFETNFDDRGLSLFLKYQDHADAQVRRGAAFGLFTQFDPANEQILAAVQKSLDDDDPIVRRVSLKTMALTDYPREAFLESVPRIAKHLDDEYEPDVPTRAHAARMLRRWTTSCQAALPALDDAMRNDPEFNVRSASLAALYDIAQTADEALTTPTWLLANDPDPRLRRRAAIQLGKYKAAAAPAIPQLIKSLADQGVPQRSADDPLAGTDEPVCLAAADTLTLIGRPAVKPLLAATQSEDRGVRLLAIRALGHMGGAAIEAVGPLETLTQSPDAGIATAAKAALVRIGMP